MNELELILLALRSQENKLRKKADKAFREGRPESHVQKLYHNAGEVNGVYQQLKVGKLAVIRVRRPSRASAPQTPTVAGTP